MPYEFQLLRRVEFADTDLAGIMHFSNFFRFMEAAETAFMRSLGLSVVLSRAGLDVCLPRVHAECDFAAPLHFEDEVLIHLLVEKKGTRTLTYQFRFIRRSGSPPREVARGRIVAVCAARESNGSLKAVPLPKLLADKIQTAPADMLNGALSLDSGPKSQKSNRSSRNTQHATRSKAS
ncbi:MAG TPA: thioesterase family protein [Candidatus Limnocylindrales bacterium]|jgi:YbgC/YbaW family acyl-CoA thioester hydrolase|nr:thioesterase family protein [Candidatus Limnocylindrales bacterium]